jgi:hypothetical protein
VEIVNIGGEFRFYSALLCSFVVIYLIFKKPPGLLFIGLIINSGLGSTLVFNISFANIAVFLQLITIGKLLNLLQFKKKLNFQLPRVSIIYIISLIVLLLKVFFHIFFTARPDEIFIFLEIGKTFLFTVVLPTLIFYLSVKVYGINIVSKDILVGTLFLGLSVLIPFLFPLFNTGYLIEGLQGSIRIKMYSEDTINGARIFFLISITSILAIFLKLNFQIKNVYLIIIFLFSFLLLVLSGSRQFILPITGILFFYNNLIRGTIFKIMFSLLVIFSFLKLDFTQNESISRLNRASFNEEALDSRGYIWSLGFTQMFTENPFLGLGYSKFGDGFSFDGQNSLNKSYLRKMTPHGFLQSIFIEQGIPLGLLFLVMFIFIVSFYNKNYFTPYHKALFILIVSFNWAESFSGDIENSFSFYLLPFILTKLKDD